MRWEKDYFVNIYKCNNCHYESTKKEKAATCQKCGGQLKRIKVKEKEVFLNHQVVFDSKNKNINK